MTGVLLAEKGYTGTSMDDIAHAAGTKAGSLYYHFDSREQLAEEVLVSGIRAAMEHTTAAVEDLPIAATARRRLETAITAHVEFILERSPAALAGARAVGQLPSALAAPVNALFREYGTYLAGLFEAVVAEGAIDDTVDLSVARMLVVGAANWTAEWFDSGGTSSPNEVGHLLCRLIFDGIGTGRRLPRRAPRGGKAFENGLRVGQP
ncbi:MAG: TetR/AcrR family transcriptional regulator [Ilumatobacteraceae bacterium]